MVDKEKVATEQAKNVLVQRHYREFASIYKYKLSRVKADADQEEEVIE